MENVKTTAEQKLLSGDEAVARGAWEAGLRVACAYPGTPSTEILETIAGFDGVDAQWSVNEKVAFEVAFGSAIAGGRSLYASKHVGLNVAMDPLMTASYTGVNAGFVAVVCDDPGLASSQNEQDTRWVAPYSKLPMIEPASPSEALAFVKESFTVSERFDTPVLFRMTTRVAHSKENVSVGIRQDVALRPFSPDIPKYVMVPRNAYQKHIRVEKRLVALAALSEKTPLNRIEKGSAKLGFITSGIAYQYIRESYPDASVLKLGFIYPFCDKKIASFAKSVREVVVVEELDPIIEEHVRMLGIKIRAKHPTFRIGELLPEHIPLICKGAGKKELPSTARKPVLCPGCPHRFVFTVLKRNRVVVTGDIGCYTLAATSPLSTLHTCLCMGSSITIHEGFRRILHDGKIVGVLGDSTFVHSGITGLINAVYNRVKGLIVILDNSTTAMTGGQNHPATGKTIRDEPTRQLSIESICEACGVDHVDVIDPKEHKKLDALVKERLSGDGLSVIIARMPCRLFDRSKSQMPEYDSVKCKTCGLCFALDCPALVKTEDGHVDIQKSLCTGCYLCVDSCAAGALRRPQ
jgi:indolepyruvate ferredoxin oxidoreductase, alpha subunit